MKNKKNIESKQNEIICENCGAKLVFKPGANSLTCGFCGNLNEIKVDRKAIIDARQEIDYLDFIRNNDASAVKIEITTVKCQGCGAETTFDNNIVSSVCDFCSSPLVSKDAHKLQIIKPKAMLSFKITNKESIDLFRNWLKKRWFAPNKLKNYAKQTEKLSGIYIPYWTYDADTTTNYSGQRGDNYQETETYTENGEQKTKTVTKTKWSFVRGTVSRFFNDVLIPASNSLPKKYVERLAPWDLDNLLPYNTKYLSGFKSETYQIDLKTGFEQAKDKMENEIKNDVRIDIGGDKQQISSMNTRFYETTFKHILLPIWISAYSYNNKVYRFMINGRTGEVQGERPWSVIKIIFAVIITIAIIGGLYWYFK